MRKCQSNLIQEGFGISFAAVKLRIQLQKMLHTLHKLIIQSSKKTKEKHFFYSPELNFLPSSILCVLCIGAENARWNDGTSLSFVVVVVVVVVVSIRRVFASRLSWRTPPRLCSFFCWQTMSKIWRRIISEQSNVFETYLKQIKQLKYAEVLLFLRPLGYKSSKEK